MRIWIQLKLICKTLPYEEFSGVEKDKKDCSKVKNHGPDPNLLTIKTNFLSFFSFFPPIFPFWIRFQEGKWMRIHADPHPQPWKKDTFSLLYFPFQFEPFSLSSFLIRSVADIEAEIVLYLNVNVCTVGIVHNSEFCKKLLNCVWNKYSVPVPIQTKNI